MLIEPGDNAVGDGPMMDEDDSLYDCSLWSPLYFDACALPAPGAGLVLDEPGIYMFDTDLGTLRDPKDALVPVVVVDLGSARGIYADFISLSGVATLMAVGDSPFAVVARDSLEVVGEVDVSSTELERGAGGDDSACATDPSLDGAQQSEAGAGGSGGAGGSFATAGAAGGASTKNGQVVPGGIAPLGAEAPAFPRGGCPGGFGIGRIDVNSADIGRGGSGGGAVLLAARLELHVSGTVAANGAGGSAGPAWAGGGGGGSGGLIALDASFLSVTPGARIVANGGGGGGATAHDEMALPGSSGSLSSLRAAHGGRAVHEHASAGGDGAVLKAAAEPGMNGEDSGGGGGGGLGYVLMHVSSKAISPAATLSPRAQEI